MPTAFRFTSKDLAAMPRIEGVRYEIIDRELYVSNAPHWDHQNAADELEFALRAWNKVSRAGATVTAPGLVFADDQDVIPDIVWVSHNRRAHGMDAAGHLTIAPELVVEVLLPGSTNERRDRDVKLSLYSRRGVDEYWIVDWRARQVEVNRRIEVELALVATLTGDDTLTSPLLPGFACSISTLWTPTAG